METYHVLVYGFIRHNQGVWSYKILTENHKIYNQHNGYYPEWTSRQRMTGIALCRALGDIMEGSKVIVYTICNHTKGIINGNAKRVDSTMGTILDSYAKVSAGKDISVVLGSIKHEDDTFPAWVKVELYNLTRNTRHSSAASQITTKKKKKVKKSFPFKSKQKKNKAKSKKKKQNITFRNVDYNQHPLRRPNE